MHRSALSLVTLSAVCTTGSLALADTVIDTTGFWGDLITGNWDKQAQTFRVPTTDRVLSTWELGVRSSDNATYTLQVYAWDPTLNHTTGPALFDSGPHAATPDLTFVEHPIGVTLQSDAVYAVVLDWSSAAFSGVAMLGGDAYPDGYGTLTQGPVDEPWEFDETFGDEAAFRAVFVPVPAPGATLPLALLGLAARRTGR